MDNENLSNLTNPYDLVDIELLDYFKQCTDIAYASAFHDHDGRYYTETEVDNKLSVKSNISHNHDSKYATKEELNNAVVGAMVNDAFYFEVDRTTMKLHAYSANSFALNFRMENGYLVASSASE